MQLSFLVGRILLLPGWRWFLLEPIGWLACFAFCHSHTGQTKYSSLQQDAISGRVGREDIHSGIIDLQNFNKFAIVFDL